MIMTATSFRQVAIKYKAVFFDAYGVLKHSKGLMKGAYDVIQLLKDNGIDYYVLTNDASKSPTTMADFYNHEKKIFIPEERIISSGLLARQFLYDKFNSGTAVYVGKESSAFYIEDAGMKAIPIEKWNSDESPDALVFLDDEGFDWTITFNKCLNLIRNNTLPTIVANPDYVYPVDEKEVGLAIGSMAEMLEKITGRRFIYFGKPHVEVFSFAMAKVAERNPEIRKSELLMVGDTLTTDILGGNHFGIDTMLVLSGNTSQKKYEGMISHFGIVPTHISESIQS